VFSAG